VEENIFVSKSALGYSWRVATDDRRIGSLHRFSFQLEKSLEVENIQSLRFAPKEISIAGKKFPHLFH
jgi:hypothetical protein